MKKPKRGNHYCPNTIVLCYVLILILRLIILVSELDSRYKTAMSHPSSSPVARVTRKDLSSVGPGLRSTPIMELDEQLVARDELLRDLKRHLEAAGNRMKQNADAKRRDVHFDVGDWVFLRLQPYRQHSIFRRTSQKLSTRYFGPFQIEARVGPVAYRLKLPEGTKIHSVFHVSLLKKRVGSDTPTSGSLPPLRTNGQLRLKPAQILEERTVTRDGEAYTEVLVLWDGLGRDDATWEDWEQLRLSFPSLNLEDKILVDGESNDGVAEPVRRTSSRVRVPNRRYN